MFEQRLFYVFGAVQSNGIFLSVTESPACSIFRQRVHPSLFPAMHDHRTPGPDPVEQRPSVERTAPRQSSTNEISLLFANQTLISSRRS